MEEVKGKMEDCHTDSELLTQFHKNTPQLRFSGFEKDNKLEVISKKFCDVCDFSKGYGYSKSDLKKEGTPIILYGRLYTKYETVINDVDTFVEAKNNSVYSKGGEVIVPASGETAEDIAVASVVSKSGVLLGGDLNIIKPSKEVDPTYLALNITYGQIHDEIAKRAQGKSVVHIHNSDFAPLTLYLLPITYQQKIGAFLSHVDSLIQAKTKKLESLKAVKKSLLQKCFPRTMSNVQCEMSNDNCKSHTANCKLSLVPEMRFAGFSGDWEEKNLGDESLEIIAGGDINKEKTVEKGKYPIYANALTNDGLVGFYDDYFRVEAPAVTVTGRGEIGHAQARLNNFTPVVRLLSIRTKHDCCFLENAINIHPIIIEATGVPQLTVPQLASYKICFPPTLEEQQKIGQFFSKYDSLISAQQKEIDKLKEVKKALLQKMFI